MQTNTRAAVTAVIVCTIAMALLLSPLGLVLGHFVLIWPVAWAIDDLGVFDLGQASNGFFLPNAGGYCFAAADVWLIAFLLIRRVLRRKGIQ